MWPYKDLCVTQDSKCKKLPKMTAAVLEEGISRISEKMHLDSKLEK